MKTTKSLLATFIALLLLSGLTAFPLRMEAEYLMSIRHLFPPVLTQWITRVHASISATPDIMLYGTDWLAFAHIVIALFFIPVYKDPHRYIANLQIGKIACIGVFFIAFICGPIRNIPFFHQLIDCSFGVIGFILLWKIEQRIKISVTTKSSRYAVTH